MVVSSAILISLSVTLTHQYIRCALGHQHGRISCINFCFLLSTLFDIKRDFRTSAFDIKIIFIEN